MHEELILVTILLISGFAVIAYFLRSWLHEISEKQKPSEELLAWLNSTNQRLDEQNKNIVSVLQSSTKSLNERLDNAARFIASVQRNIGEMSEIGRGMKELQEFLKSPKLRGNIGEQILKELLSQVLPKQAFYLQHAFRSGAVVDAAIKTGSGIIPIDSKFPMDSFRKIITVKEEAQKEKLLKEFEKGVKKHIDDISQKYILTEEGTIDYALMYLPSEAVYYEVVNNQTLYEHAVSKRVLPVSPMTFYAYLRAILMSFEGQKIESQAKQILLLIRAVQKDYTKVEENLGVLNRHLTNAYNQLSNVLGSFTLLGQKLSSTKNIGEKEKGHETII